MRVVKGKKRTSGEATPSSTEAVAALHSFAERLAELRLPRVDAAIALLWYLDSQSPGVEKSPTDLVRLMSELSLASSDIHVTRFGEQLAARDGEEVVRGKSGFKLHAGARATLAKKYGELVGIRRAAITSELIPSATFAGTRPYFEMLVREINGSYSYGFYNGCAALCRRLMEMLLIEAFEKHGKAAAIRVSTNEYAMLNKILSEARSGSHFKLARNTGKELEDVKNIGDRAAHHRTYMVARQDVDNCSAGFRAALSDLLSLAGIQATTT